jgi:hypothetical protein
MLQVSFRLKFATRHDDDADVYVGYCPALKLYSQGVTEEEASTAVVSAATLFLVTCYERDILHSVLRRRGMTKAAAGAAGVATDKDKEFIVIGEFQNEFWREVPISLLAAQGAAVQCQQ